MENEGSQEADIAVTDEDNTRHGPELNSDTENVVFHGFGGPQILQEPLVGRMPGNAFGPNIGDVANLLRARMITRHEDNTQRAPELNSHTERVPFYGFSRESIQEPIVLHMPGNVYDPDVLVLANLLNARIAESEDETHHELDSDSENSGFVGFIPARMGNLTLFSSLTERPDSGESNIGEMGNDDERFNEDLPAVHSYLGENLEEVSGRMIYTESRYVQIPLLSGQYGPLLPGQTFPLTVRDGGRTAMLRSCVEGDHTFGCVSTSQPGTDYIFGTTAEIFEYADDMGTVSIKAKGRQRFQLISKGKPFDRRQFRMAEVYILPEVKLQHPFNALDFKSLNGLRTSQKEKCRKIESGLMPWPKWVYDMYDPEKLVERADKLTFLKQGLRKEKGQSVIMPKDPTELSFWIASHLDADKRLFILKLNSPIPRLRWLLSFLSKNHIYTCTNCDVVIGKQSDIFAMSIEGAQSTYVNSEGYHHDTVTLLKAQNIVPTTPASTHFSWFPGYAWKIAVCGRCKKHLGWQFIAVDTKLWPNKFWGLTRHALETHFNFGESNHPDDQPIM